MKKNFIGVFVSLLFIGALAYLMREKIPEVIQVLKNADQGLIFISTLVFLSTAFIMAVRLKLIFRTKEIAIKLSDTVNLTFVGYFFNNFLPTSVGGDIVKAMCLARLTRHPVKSVTVVMMDRIFGLFMFVLIPSTSLLFLKDRIDPRVPLTVYSFLGFSLAFFFFLFNPSVAKRFHLVENFLNRFGIGSKIRLIYDELHDFKNHKGVVLSAMALSIFGQVVGIFVFYLLSVALGADPGTWPYFLLLVPVVQLISMTPSLGGLGIRESAYVYFLKGYIGAERALAVGILFFGLLFLSSVIGGIIYVLRHDYHMKFDKLTKPGGLTP